MFDLICAMVFGFLSIVTIGLISTLMSEVRTYQEQQKWFYTGDTREIDGEMFYHYILLKEGKRIEIWKNQ